MKFTKQELSFLDLFSMYVDSSIGQFGDKVIMIKQDDHVLFLQKGRDDILFTKKIEKEAEDFEPIIYETQKLNQIIKYLPDNSDIEIDGTKISVSEDIQYEFESFDYGVDNSSFTTIVDLLDDLGSATKKVSLVDVDKIANIYQFMGERLFSFDSFDNLNLIAYFNNYYVASDRYHVTAAVQNASSIDEDFYFHSIVYSVAKYLDEKDVDIHIFKDESDEDDTGKCVMNFGDLSVFFPHTEESCLPNILEDDKKEFYEHNDYIVIEKDKLLSVLQRIMIITNAELKDRVFITFSKNNIVIESKDNGYAKEVLPVKESNLENDISFILSSKYLVSTVKLIDKSNILIKIPDEDGVAIKVQGSDDESKFYVVNLLDDFQA